MNKKVIYTITKYKMTERKELQTHVETVDKGLMSRVVGTALLGTLLFGKVATGMAHEVETQEKKENSNEIVIQTPNQQQLDTLITWDNSANLSKQGSDQLESESLDEGKKGEQGGKEKKKTLEVHGSVRCGTDVTPLLGSVLSDKPALILTIDASNPQTGLGVSITRADDFNLSPDWPAGQLTIGDFNIQQQFGKFTIMGVGEYVHIDKLSGADSFTPIIGGIYDAGNGWKVDAWACHTFQKGDDVDVIRLGVTKQLDESLSFAIQGFYRSDLSKKFYGRVQVNVMLGKGFGAQLSFIAQEGKITPTAGIIYKF